MAVGGASQSKLTLPIVLTAVLYQFFLHLRLDRHRVTLFCKAPEPLQRVKFCSKFGLPGRTNLRLDRNVRT